jgi:hypothetical protein
MLLPYLSWFDARFRCEWHFRRNVGGSSLTEEAKLAKEMDTADSQQTFLTWLLEVPALYAIMVGSFLSLFVPSEGVNCVTFRNDCSMSDRYGLEDPFPRVVLFFNVLTCLVLVIGNFVAGRREQFLIDYLDYDIAFPKGHLNAVLDRYPDIKVKLRFWNLSLRRTAGWSLCILIVNCLISAVFLLRRTFSPRTVCCPDITHKGVKTVTVLSSFMLLVINKLRREFVVARESKKDGLGISSLHMQPLSYNAIDHKVRSAG